MDVMIIYMQVTCITGLGMIWFSTIGYPILKACFKQFNLKSVVMDTIIYTTYILVVLFSTGIFIEIVKFIIY